VRYAAQYLAHLRSLIILNPQVEHWTVVREEVQGDMGLFRYRLSLHDGRLLEMFERFQIVEGDLQVVKYSFHWQNADGRLHKRWDNAAHHPEIATHPSHMHNGAESNVAPHAPISAEEVLALVEAQATGQEGAV
jgi:hypothetical protein